MKRNASKGGKENEWMTVQKQQEGQIRGNDNRGEEDSQGGQKGRINRRGK